MCIRTLVLIIVQQFLTGSHVTARFDEDALAVRHCLTVTVTPATGQAGTSTVTLTVSDSALTTSTAFTLTVLPQPIPPAFSILGNSNVQLSWATVSGFHYQVQYSADLSQWIPLGSLTLATGSPMTWTDDGTQTGASPSTQSRRFYRLLISQ